MNASDWAAHPHCPPTDTLLGRIDEVPDGGGRVLAFGPEDRAFRLLLLRSGDSVAAWLNQCPHFGVPLALKDEWLIVKPHQSLSCNVHYARFRWQDGLCEDGDCLGESLVRLPIRLVDGNILFGAPE